MKKLATLSILGTLLALTGVAGHTQQKASAIEPSVQQPAAPAEASPAEGVAPLVAPQDAVESTLSPQAPALPTASLLGVAYASCDLTIAAQYACLSTAQRECWCDCYAQSGRNAFCIDYCGCP